MKYFAARVVLLACFLLASASSEDAVAGNFDMILGVIMHSSRLASDRAEREQKVLGLQRFVRSALHSTGAYVALASNDHDFWTRASPELAADLSHPRVLRVHVDGKRIPGLARHRSRLYDSLRIQYLRYWAYVPVLEEIVSRLNISEAQQRTSLILLSDTMDVAFQRDAFGHARAIVARAQADRRKAAEGVKEHGLSTAAAGDEISRDPLLVAEEPGEFAVMSEPISSQWMRSCFRPGVVVPSAVEDALHTPDYEWGKLPSPRPNGIICSGTTMGNFPAIRRYIEAMTRLLPFCMSSLRTSPGVDQSVHIMMLSARLAAGDGKASQPDDHQLQLSAAAEEPTYARFLAISRQFLSTVDLHVIPHDWGWVCTFGLPIMADQSVPVTAWGAPGPG